MPLVCTIELSKTAGITIKVENADDSITQTIVMNGTSIVTTVQGSEKTSKITQDQNTVKVEVKDFIVEAETITCHSTGATSHKSDDVIGVESTKDMTIKSSAKLTQESTQDMSLKSSAKLAAEATADATFKGMNLTAEATAAAKLKGAQTAVEGSATADLKAPAASVKGDATLTLEGAMLTVKGNMQTLQGQLVKIG